MEVALVVFLLVLLAAPPSLLARAGVGRRGTWFGASAGCLLTVLVLFLRNCNWGREASGITFDPIEDADYFARMAGEFCGLAAVAFAVAGCFYKPRPKEPGIFGK